MILCVQILFLKCDVKLCCVKFKCYYECSNVDVNKFSNLKSIHKVANYKFTELHKKC